MDIPGELTASAIIGLTVWAAYSGVRLLLLIKSVVSPGPTVINPIGNGMGEWRGKVETLVVSQHELLTRLLEELRHHHKMEENALKEVKRVASAIEHMVSEVHRYIVAGGRVDGH